MGEMDDDEEGGGGGRLRFESVGVEGGSDGSMDSSRWFGVDGWTRWGS